MVSKIYLYWLYAIKDCGIKDEVWILFQTSTLDFSLPLTMTVSEPCLYSYRLCSKSISSLNNSTCLFRYDAGCNSNSYSSLKSCSGGFVTVSSTCFCDTVGYAATLTSDSSVFGLWRLRLFGLSAGQSTFDLFSSSGNTNKYLTLKIGRSFRTKRTPVVARSRLTTGRSRRKFPRSTSLGSWHAGIF